MREIKYTLCALCAVFAMTSAALGATALQQEDTVSVQLQTGLVKLGAQVIAQVTVEGTMQARILAVEPVDGLEFLGTSNPKRSVFESITRGRRTRSESLTWSLRWRAERVGSFVIPPVRLDVGGQEVTTQEMNLRVIEDFQGQDLGYMEWIDPPTEVFEGQLFEVVLRFGWDAGMSNFNHANLILPWWGRLPGTLEVAEPMSTGKRRIDISLNDTGVVRVEELGSRNVNGRELRLFELRRSFVSTRTGSLSFPTSHFEFGRIDSGFFERRRNTYFVAWPAFDVDVQPLPEEGRPFEFSGGVGDFEARASLDRRSIDLGESLKLTIEWVGEGNLEFFEPPDLGREDDFDDFRSYGATDRFHGDRRVLIYDIAPANTKVTEVPAVRLSIFDPKSAEYTTVETAPIPIRVRLAESYEELSVEGVGEAVGLDLRDIATTPRTEGQGVGPRDRALLGLSLTILLGWIALRREVRRRGDPGSVNARRRRRARRRLLRGLRGATDAREQALALRVFIGDRTCEPATAWEGRDVSEYAMGAAGVDASAVESLAVSMEELDAVIWSGEGGTLERERLLSAVDEAIGGGL